jgi:hypothetical protein
MANSQDDIQRLAKTYAAKHDDELIELAEDSDSLTDAARTALDAELARRNISLAPESPTGDAPSPASNAPESAAIDPRNLVVVATFRDLPPALIAKNVLDTAGIRNFLIDATTIRFDWLLSNALGGVKLGVERQDLEKAKQALERGMETVELPEDQDVLLPHCPRCMSPTVEGRKLDPPRASFTAWRCDDCGTQWEMDAGDLSQK